jgi:uncharacterized protein (DUF1501 family)
MIVGGSIAGGQILGHYPTDLTQGPADSLNIGRGRMIPTTPWEAIWWGMAQWFDVHEDQVSRLECHSHDARTCVCQHFTLHKCG